MRRIAMDARDSFVRAGLRDQLEFVSCYALAPLAQGRPYRTGEGEICRSCGTALSPNRSAAVNNDVRTGHI